MLCEMCSKEHLGTYGSGRFCNEKCAHGFCTKAKRSEISLAVSKALKGKPFSGKPGVHYGGGHHRPHLEEAKAKISLTQRTKFLQKEAKTEFQDLSHSSKRKRVLEEQGNQCLICGIDSWLGEKLIFELDHIDGNNRNNQRENLRGLCPNCHSQTPTYRRYHR